MSDQFESGLGDAMHKLGAVDPVEEARLLATLADLPERRSRWRVGRLLSWPVAAIGATAIVIVLALGLASRPTSAPGGSNPSSSAQPRPSAALTPSPSPSVPLTNPAFVMVENRSGPALKVVINGLAVGNIACGADSRFLVGTTGLPDLPWTVQIVSPDGSTFTTSIDTAEFRRYVQVWARNVLSSDQPFTGGPTTPPCPSDSSGHVQSAAPVGGLSVSGAAIFGSYGLWATSNGEVVTSIDAGAHWLTVGPASLGAEAIDANHVWTISAGPGSTEQNGSSTDVLNPVVARTTDGGATWATAIAPGNYANSFLQLRFLDSKKGYLLASPDRQSTGAGALLGTTDGGATWSILAALKWPGSTFGVTADGTLWIGANDEAGTLEHPLLIVSRDAGKTWSNAVLPGLEGRTGGAELYVPEPPVFWTSDEGVVEVADVNGPVRIYRTTDGGRTWTLASERPTGGEGGGTEGGAFINPSTWMLDESGASGTSIAKTTDGGSTWTTFVPSGIDPAAGILSLAFWDDERGTAVVEAGTSMELQVSSDGGMSWEPSDANDSASTIPTVVAGQPVLSGQAVAEHILAATDSSPFLVGGYVEDVQANCFIPSGLPGSPLTKPCDDGWMLTGEPNAVVGAPWPVGGSESGPYGLVESTVTGWPADSQTPVVLRVHVHDQRAASCAAAIYSACERAIVVEAAVWSGSSSIPAP